MKERDEERRSEITAYHEAGHAVAFYLLHKRFKYVTIKPEGEKWGEIVYNKKILKQHTIPSERELRFMKRECMVSLAGPIAEKILSGKCEFEDILPFLDLPSSRSENEWETDMMFWKPIFVDTKLLIYAPWNWHAVGALADELEKQKKIRYKEARKIIRNAIEDYQGAVRSGMCAVDPGYLDFVKRVEDARAKFKERARAAIMEIMGRRR